MDWDSYRRFVLTVLCVGAATSVIGVLASLLTGQYAQWEQYQWNEPASQSGLEGNEFGAGLGISCCYLVIAYSVFPFCYLYIALRWPFYPGCYCGTSILRIVGQIIWTVWCGIVILFFLVIGPLGRPYDQQQWDIPGFFIQSVGSCVSAAGHLFAIAWRPVHN
jgi:hypothetical protein